MTELVKRPWRNADGGHVGDSLYELFARLMLEIFQNKTLGRGELTSWGCCESRRK